MTRPKSSIPGRVDRAAASPQPRRWAAATAVALLAAAPVALAQAPTGARIQAGNGDGADAHLFRAPVDSKGFLSVNGADVLGGGEISFGLVLDYGYGLMPLSDGHGASYMVKHAFQGTVQFDYGIANVLVVGVSAPVVVNAGDPATDIGPGGSQNYSDNGITEQALGNVALHAKLRLLRPTGESPLGVAIIFQGGGGAGGTTNFASDPGFFYWPEAVLERRFGSEGGLRLGLNAGYRGHTGANPTFGLGQNGLPELTRGVFEYGNLFTGGFAISGRVASSVDLIAETYGTYLLGGASDSRQRLSAEAIGGIKLFVQENSYFTIGAGSGYLLGFEAAVPRAMIGFMFEPTLGDEPKREKVSDKWDTCPDGSEKHGGVCPPTDGDRDGDGILDSHDKCPDEPEDKDGFQDADGCPDPDNDQDGIPDELDKCPNDAEDYDGFQDTDGCPDPDNDKDGIPDVRDRCPNAPETFNGFEDEDGCPDKGGLIVVQENDILILEKIQFKTGSAEILPKSFPILDAVATALTHNPDFTMVEVQGHADERGAEKANLLLTQSRSKAVLEALVQRGVNRATLRSMGYGVYCPLDPAHKAAAWDKNRRVEFKIAAIRGAATDVVLGCDKAKSKGIESPPLP
jgi:OmpA-OmpF porin, OOP family